MNDKEKNQVIKTRFVTERLAAQARYEETIVSAIKKGQHQLAYDLEQASKKLAERLSNFDQQTDV